jgi:hypothetical protein
VKLPLLHISWEMGFVLATCRNYGNFIQNRSYRR